MSQEIDLGGTIYISSRRAAELTGYTQDYIGQLARSKSIEARRVSGLWYILEASLLAYKEKSDEFIPIPPQKLGELSNEVSAFFNGVEYISASRASKVSGYSADYITQLARESKVPAERSGGRWFIDSNALLAHKAEKDSLLAAVQSDSVGIRDNGEILAISTADLSERDSHFAYYEETDRHLQPFPDRRADGNNPTDDCGDTVEETQIPIRILHDEVKVDSYTTGSETILSRLPLITVAFTGVLCVLIITVLVILHESLSLAGFKNHISIPRGIEELVAKDVIYTRGVGF